MRSSMLWSFVSLFALACVPAGAPQGELGDGDDLVWSAEDLGSAEQRGDYLLFDALDVTGADRVVVQVVLGAPAELPRIEGRLVAAGEAVSEWRSFDATWSEVDHHVAVLDFEPIADTIELRLHRMDVEMLSQIRLGAAAVAELEAEAPATDTTSSGLRAELSDLSIVTRSGWGASSSRCSMSSDRNKTRMAIHHTEGSSSNPPRQLRSIQQFHANKGWCDIGYHFLIGVDGTIYEGRPLQYRGVHARNNNTGNIGISHVGTFHSTQPPAVMLASTARLVARLSDLYGVAINDDRIRGHRRWSSTDCPGNRLFAEIPSLLADARNIGSTPPPPPPPPPPPGSGNSCQHSRGGNYDHLGCSAGYQCCDGRWRTRASGCGTCVCEDPDGLNGCSAPVTQPPPPPPPPPTGASCAHSFGGTYEHLGCSAGYQCCDGSWRSRANGCGTCSCEETTGQTGCTTQPAPPPPPPPPPAGADCVHSRGGVYGHLACSPGYQCCDGSWRTRSNGCGTCVCEEASGNAGCSSTRPVPVPAGPHAGLSQGGSEIPRAGLSNGTLRGALGISTEPYGTVESYEGVQWVRGRVSHFGGPNDSGVSSTETGAITGERLRSLNSPMNPSSSQLASRPEDFYFVAMRWNYSPNGRSFWRNARILVVNPSTGARVVVRPVDWGPHTRTRRIIDLSPQSIRDLGLTTDDDALVAFAAPGTPLGPQ